MFVEPTPAIPNYLRSNGHEVDAISDQAMPNLDAGFLRVSDFGRFWEVLNFNLSKRNGVSNTGIPPNSL